MKNILLKVVSGTIIGVVILFLSVLGLYGPAFSIAVALVLYTFSEAIQ